MMSLYRQELSGPQPQEQQSTGPLPMQRPQSAPANNSMMPVGQAPQQEEFSSDIDERFNQSMRNKMRDIQNNRFTSKMQERVESMAGNLRGMIESGQMTEEEGKRVLTDAVGSEFRDVTGWMNGKTAPKNYKETANPAQSRKFLEENKQAFEKMRDLKREIAKREELLRTAYDKEDPRFQKSSQDLAQMKQRHQQMFEAIRGKMLGGNAFEGNKAMHKARGEEVI